MSLSALEALKQKRTPFPVEAVIDLYLTCNGGVLYKNYYEGTKLLLDWLAPIAPPTNTLIPDYSHSILAQNYSLGELAKHLSGETFGKRYHFYLNVIIHRVILSCQNS